MHYWGLRIRDKWLVDSTGRIVFYPDYAIADAHRQTLGGEWTVERFPR